MVKEEFKDDISDGLDFLDDPIPDDTEQLKDLYEKYTMKYAQKLSQAEIDRIVSEALEDEYELKRFLNFNIISIVNFITFTKVSIHN